MHVSDLGSWLDDCSFATARNKQIALVMWAQITQANVTRSRLTSNHGNEFRYTCSCLEIWRERADDTQKTWATGLGELVCVCDIQNGSYIILRQRKSRSVWKKPRTFTELLKIKINTP